MRISVIAVLLTALVASAVAANGKRTILYNRVAVPDEWKSVGEAHPQQSSKVIIALKQRNLGTLEDIFWAVADPKNAKYSQFMTKEEILDIIAPAQDDHDKVMEWLAVYGIDHKHIQSNGDAIFVKAPVKVLEKLFDTKMYNFVNSRGRLLARQMGTYSIPSELDQIIDMIAGISDFPMPRVRLHAFEAPAALADAYVVPETISTLYNIGTYTSSSKTSQGVAEFQDDASYSATDLATFYQQTGIKTTNVSHVVGPFSGTYPDTEATLDIQYVTAVGIDAVNWYWTEENWMYDFAVSMFNAADIPSVISMSWGWSESAQCDIDTTECSTLGVKSDAYVNRTNVEFQKIGLRGTSLVSSSGDSGANGRTDYYCTDTALHPIFPAGSPYVLAVGATQLNSPVAALKNPPPICSSYACASGGEEVAVSYTLAGFTSGGGFSNYSPRPSYQDTAVSQYLASSVALPPKTYYNTAGRGYPDIAALGHNFLCYISGSVSPVGGTSASAPTIAGIIAILNAVRLESGQKPLGFSNTFFYQAWEDDHTLFNDVTVGDNICTEAGCATTCKGFKAFSGWDPVTGLGSPNVQALVKYIQAKGVAKAQIA